MSELNQLWDIIIGSYFILIVLSSFAIGFMVAYLVTSDFWKGQL